VAEEVRDSLSPSEFGEAALAKLQGDGQANGAVGQVDEIDGVLYDEVGNQVGTAEAREVKTDTYGRIHDPDTGQYLPREAEVLQEAPPEAPPDVGPSPPEERLYAGKYRTVEEMERAYLEEDSLRGRQTNELGELRGQVQALTQLMSQPQPQPWSPPPDPEENPEMAARWAVENENEAVYTRAIAEWREIDRAAADIYEMGVAHQYELDLLKNEIEELKTFRGQTQTNMGVAGIVQRHGNIDHLVPAMGEIARQRPYIEAAVRAGDTRALDDLIAMARFQTENGARAQAEQAAELQRRREAAVVTAETGAGAAGQNPKGVDIFRQKFRERMGLPSLEP
jgi:hypothetical protein